VTYFNFPTSQRKCGRSNAVIVRRDHGMKWKDAVRRAIKRHCRSKGRNIFTRQGLIEKELGRIIADAGSTGATPDQTLSRILQELRDAGEIEFIDNDGTYCKL